MATSVNITRELISTESIIYVRPIRLSISATNLKPNTRMYAFFDGQDVNRYFTQTGGSKQQGDPLVTDSLGNLTAIFDVPGLTFTTGQKELFLSDYSIYNANQIGVSIVKATAYFSSLGTLQTYRNVKNTITYETIYNDNLIIRETDITPPPPNVFAGDAPSGDPLAQSFFTYGIDGGVTLTSIDLYFYTKDATLPVTVEIREMSNGYPTRKLVAPHARVVKSPNDVFVSSNSSIATNFEFEKLLFLEPNKEYCFVVWTNSNRYNLWLSELGGTSVETNKTIFEQPYIGSLFSSENNITWTPTQTQDIKFTLYKAKFNTNVNSSVNIAVHPNVLTMDSQSFNTFQGLNSVFITFPFKHGLDTSSEIGIVADPALAATYNGFTGAGLTGDHIITDYVDEFTVGIKIAGQNATKTGEITSNGLINAAVVTNAGQNYNENDPPVVVITGSTGSGAVITPFIKNGKIIDLIVEDPGSGYSADTTITFDSTGTTGSGAAATPVFSNRLLVYINRPYHEIQPTISKLQPESTNVISEISNYRASYEGGSITNYSTGLTNHRVELNKMNNLGSNYLATSRINEKVKLQSAYSNKLNLTLSSTNENVSPFIDLNNSSVAFRHYSVNNQKNENVLSTNSSGKVLTGPTTITITNGGSGYSTAPDIEIVGTGTGATATATVVGGVITGVVVNTAGSGYYGDVKAVAVGGGGTGAVLKVNVSDYNSELKSNYGRSHARYLTKILPVQEISTGVRCYATAYSNANSGFDVYVKTNLSTNNLIMEDIEWKLMQCNVQRNRSNSKEQFLDYEFYLDNVDPFDTYQLKFVLKTATPWDPPKINNFRAIVTA